MNYNQLAKILRTDKGKRYYSTILYPLYNPQPDDIYVITTQGDRLDILANEQYGDPTLWRIIQIANNNINRDSLYVPSGIQLRIPSNIYGILDKLDKLNLNR